MDDLYEDIMPRQENIQNPENSNTGKVTREEWSASLQLTPIYENKIKSMKNAYTIVCVSACV